MACSCKNKTVKLAASAKQSDSVSVILPIVEPVQQYTFTATTLPLQQCYYCAQKHIATATVLLSQHSRFKQYQAAGQLLLSTYHMPQRTGIDELILQTAQKIITQAEYKPDYRQLYQLNSRIEQIIQTTQKPDKVTQIAPPDSSQTYVHAFMHIAAAYQLLLEPYYEMINKSYVIGELCYAAVILRKYSSQHISPLRQIWKILQQSKSMNDQYYADAKDMLTTYLKMWPSYQLQFTKQETASTLQ